MSISAALGQPTRLTHQQIIALSGEWYRRKLASHEADPGDADDWRIRLDQLEQAEFTGKVDELAAPYVDELLTGEGLRVDDDTRFKLTHQMFRRAIDLCNDMIARAEGNYAVPKILTALPEWKPIDPKVTSGGPTFQELVDAWRAEKKPAERTYYEFQRAMMRLVVHQGCASELDRKRPWNSISDPADLHADERDPTRIVDLARTRVSETYRHAREYAAIDAAERGLSLGICRKILA